MKVIVKNALLGFNDLFNAKCIGESEVPKFSATLICTPETTIQYTKADGEKVTVPYEKMQMVCDHVLKEKFGKVPVKHKNWAYNAADGSTTRDQYTDKDGEYWAGIDKDSWFISANKPQDQCTDGKLTVLDQARDPIGARENKIFSGCSVNVVIDVYAFAGKKGNPDGVTASLEGIQLKKKGEPLGFTRTDAANDFEDEEFEEGEIDFGAEPTDEMM